MNYKDWTTLKTAGKVAFKKIPAVDEVKDSDGNITTNAQKAYTVLEKKRYNPDTGEESTVQETMSLSELEAVKAQKTTEKAALQTEIAEIGKMITQIKKV
tara:strand:- start:150 stop:449 length:300 start_codon:yes stop_codon:yes gene_type:complete